jgi:uncharacterized membrane protein
MLAPVLSVAVLMGSGTVAGVLFGVALSTMPALIAMPSDRYVYVHKLLGRNWDPTMPLIVLTSTLIDVVLAVLAPTSLTRVQFAFAAVLLFGVSFVSHLCNVPINRQIKRLDPEAIPPDWEDPRLAWRNWNLLRTLLAVLALALNGLAVTFA